ncbi:alpha/beta fold hydrolase BchO [Palleronia caenipelagi]|uniref:Alpha/beta fold hydrolase n=1 Tax=Palleronia caenipelagi TaxID=2489174 RepID=A0A547Q904_9RHOB|nr:alpha/beta fold hydrolase BchO [Palleronia caenipelagi]TRD22877.1 alpha/beta fold hydrolase [Palleronia caenipelagi]
MDWDRDGGDWPNREASQFIAARPHRWHVQVMGEGPDLLLLHGTGATTHSWRDVLPLLAKHYRVIAPDLPGHGFTKLGRHNRSSMEAMAEDCWTLCDELDVAPHAIIGHSAGGAVALRMAQIRQGPATVIGINAALGDFDGPAGFLFPMMAKALSMTPFVSLAFSQLTTRTGGVARLLDGTGSTIDARGRKLYARTVASAAHVEGALLMMAQWSTRAAREGLPGLKIPVTFLAAENDRTVPAKVSRHAATQAPNGCYISMGRLGHLAHEEDPNLAVRLILDAIPQT